LLDHYLYTGRAADKLLRGHRDELSLEPHAPSVTPEPLASHHDAIRWYTAEYRGLLAGIAATARTGPARYVWRLVWVTGEFLARRGHWQDLVAAQTAALHAAQQLTDRAGEAQALSVLARAYAYLGRSEDAYCHARRAVDIQAALGDHIGQAHASCAAGQALVHQGRHRAALDCVRHALDLYRTVGDVTGHARTLNLMGWCEAQIGQHRRALAHCRQSIRLLRQLGDRQGEAATWDTVGYVHRHLGHLTEVVTCYQRAVDMYREVDDRYNEAESLTGLGDTHDAAGRPGAARAAWQRALDILAELHHPGAVELRVKLGAAKATQQFDGSPVAEPPPVAAADPARPLVEGSGWIRPAGGSDRSEGTRSPPLHSVAQRS
jgi:tetratricopeptide (TPR) repeat protein